MIRSAMFRLRTELGAYPRIFFPIYRLAPKNRRLAISRGTDLVIEGFPRSANTFAVAALERLAPDLSIAHHLHVPAQLMLAVRRGVPAVLLLRRPEDAVISLAIRHRHISLKQAIEAYEKFHAPLLPYASSLFLARFEDVTTDYGAVLAAMRSRFDVALPAFTHNPDSVRDVFRYIDSLSSAGGGDLDEEKVARPSPARGQVRERMQERLRDPQLRRSLERCASLYRRFLAA